MKSSLSAYDQKLAGASRSPVLLEDYLYVKCHGLAAQLTSS